jgi:hypothetical protein
MSGDEAMSIFS